MMINKKLRKEDIKRYFFVLMILVFSLQYSTYLISNIKVDAFIKIASFGSLLIIAMFSGLRIKKTELILVLLFCLLFLFSTLPSMKDADVTGGITALKLFYMFMILPIILVSYRGIRGSHFLLLKITIFIGALFSVQAIIAAVGVYLGVLDKSHVLTLQRYGNQEVVSFGLWGYGNAIQAPAFNLMFLRPQGWFLEPSKLASFLLLPAFSSLGLYKVRNERVYLYLSWVIFSGIAITLSLANFFAVACAALLYTFSRKVYATLRILPVIRYGYGAFVMVIFVVLAVGIMEATYYLNNLDKTELSNVQLAAANLLGRDSDGPSGNLFREQYKAENYYQLLLNSPFGLGLGERTVASDFRTGNALLFWFTAGGILAVAVVLVLFAYIFLVFCHPLLISSNPFYSAIGASFIGHSIQNLSYGNWIAPYYLLHLAVVVMLADDVSNKRLLMPSETKNLGIA